MRRLLLVGVAALTVVIVGVTAYSAPAFARRRRHRKPPPATSGSVVIGNQATLSADHRTADVVLAVTCPVGSSPTPVRVSLHQNGTGGSALSGTDYVCNGYAQQVVVPVGGSGSLRTGPAQAAASGAWHIAGATSNARDSSSSTSATIQLV